MDWLDLLAVQGTLKSLLQYHSSKASILQCPAFLTVQLSHPYMTTGKTTESLYCTEINATLQINYTSIFKTVKRKKKGGTVRKRTEE